MSPHHRSLFPQKLTHPSAARFYNLAAYPAIIPELRAEVKQVLSEHDNQMSTAALQSMKKLDSFLKETMRFHPPGAASFRRKVLRPFTLSNGQRIPAGVIIEVPAQAIARDPAVFPEPDKFDALRFYKLRQEARDNGEVEASAQNQFVSVSPSSLTFGYGRHACPGRFLAANEIKMVIANALLLYDIRNVEGVEERYPNMEFGGTVSFSALFRDFAWMEMLTLIRYSLFRILPRSCCLRGWHRLELLIAEVVNGEGSGALRTSQCNAMSTTPVS